jgi:hypothetical protein
MVEVAAAVAHIKPVASASFDFGFWPQRTYVLYYMCVHIILYIYILFLPACVFLFERAFNLTNTGWR